MKRATVFFIAIITIIFTIACISSSSGTNSGQRDEEVAQDRHDSAISEEERSDPEVEVEEPTPFDVVSEMSADYLFKDDFETGIRTEWRVIDGEWRMVDGTLKAISGQSPIITVGDNQWRNITVEMEVGGLVNTTSSAMMFLENRPNMVGIGIKQNGDASDGYWFSIYNSGYLCGYEVQDEFFELSSGDGSYSESKHDLRVEVKDDFYQFYIDQEKVCTFSDSTYTDGIFLIWVSEGSGSEPAFPWIDSVTIAEN
jgi:hypothetical protein